MKQHLMELERNPSKENLEIIKKEIRRSEDVIKYHRMVVWLLDWEYKDKKVFSKNLDIIEYEIDFQSQAEIIKQKIANSLLHKN